MVTSRRPRTVALIPARGGSVRVPQKNIRVLDRHPLIAYSIAAAQAAALFEAVVVSTDDAHVAAIARHYGAEVPFLRPQEFATATSPDVEWVEFTLTALQRDRREYDCFAILRPTSPFRTGDTIRRAWEEFVGEEGVDSLRAVELCKQHPAKMWIVSGRRMVPLLPLGPMEQPWHSSQYPTLPTVYMQNASLELAWSRVVFEQHTIAGSVIMPFFTSPLEGFDINDSWDWMIAEEMVRSGEGPLPPVSQPPYPDTVTTPMPRLRG